MSIIYQTQTGSGQMLLSDKCLILSKGDFFCRELNFSDWESIRLGMIYSFTSSGSSQDISSGSIKNYFLPQSSPESRFLFGVKNENNYNLPLSDLSSFIGFGGSNLTSSLEVYQTGNLIKVRTDVSGSDRGSVCYIKDKNITGSYTSINSASILSYNRNLNSYPTGSQYNLFILEISRSGSLYNQSYCNRPVDSCSLQFISQSINSYSPQFILPTMSFETFVYYHDMFLIKSWEFGPHLRIHSLGAKRLK